MIPKTKTAARVRVHVVPVRKFDLVVCGRVPYYSKCASVAADKGQSHELALLPFFKCGRAIEPHCEALNDLVLQKSTPANRDSENHKSRNLRILRV